MYVSYDLFKSWLLQI